MSDQGLKDLEASVAAHAKLESLEAENAALRELLKLARKTIDGLADQQCPPDDWYEKPLAEIDAALGEKTG